jgi:RNA polymerase sigma-70 factor (ECF subfamily)
MAQAVTIPGVAGSGEDARGEDARGDDALVEAARRDPRAFEALYLRHRLRVYRYLRARVGDDEDAADLTATTFERALAGLRGYRPAGAGFAAWLLRIARNAAIDAERRRGRRRLVPLDEGMEIAGDSVADAGLAAAEARADLLQRLGRLPEPQRDALVLRYGSRLTAGEIGAVIGKSEAATQKLLTRALGALKEAYRDHE